MPLLNRYTMNRRGKKRKRQSDQAAQNAAGADAANVAADDGNEVHYLLPQRWDIISFASSYVKDIGWR